MRGPGKRSAKRLRPHRPINRSISMRVSEPGRRAKTVLRPRKLRFHRRQRQRMTSKLTTHARSEEHTSELQSLMRQSYAVVCLKKKRNKKERHNIKTII